MGSRVHLREGVRELGHMEATREADRRRMGEGGRS